MRNDFITALKQNKIEKKEYRWNIAVTVLTLFLIGSILNIPFSREVKRLNIEAGLNNVRLNESIFEDFFAVGISSLIIGVIIIFVGLWVSERANLGAPLIASIFSKQSFKELIDIKAVLSSIILAILTALLLLGLFELQKEFYPVASKMARPTKDFYALVSFSAGITEEIIFRLGLMSLIITANQFFRKKENPSSKIIWSGIFISALFFGLVHLPLSKNFVELTSFSVGVTMFGNLITGSVFGWIFWKQGLLVAIISHIVFDLVFHVIGSPFG
ncbi:CPBP family intramembrane metalloprotease [Kriegella sp. EG-1]|nr:CPBP family intramembrane metalloprotease [Flavobacteriaceae bacterium EG-1]